VLLGSAAVQALLAIIDRFVRLSTHLSSKKVKRFEELYDPTFQDLRKVHTDYLAMFRAVQKEVPPPFRRRDPSYEQQLVTALEKLRDLRVAFAPVRVELKTLASSLAERELQPGEKPFADALFAYFAAGAMLAPGERSDLGWWTTASTALIDLLEHPNALPEGKDPADLIHDTVRVLESNWRELCAAYESMRLDIRLRGA
jgi:hypothetical protein